MCFCFRRPCIPTCGYHHLLKAVMRWPRLLAVLVFALASPIQAVGNILGPDWTYKVNDMNLLDRLRMSPSISPECASGVYTLSNPPISFSRMMRSSSDFWCSLFKPDILPACVCLCACVCLSALAGVRVNGSRAARADLLSGRVVEVRHPG